MTEEPGAQGFIGVYIWGLYWGSIGVILGVLLGLY